MPPVAAGQEWKHPRSYPTSMALRQRLAQSGSAQRRLVRSASRTAGGERAVNHHRRYRADAQAPGPTGNLRVLHVEDGHLTGWASHALDHGDRLITDGAPGAEHFTLRFPFMICLLDVTGQRA